MIFSLRNVVMSILAQIILLSCLFAQDEPSFPMTLTLKNGQTYSGQGSYRSKRNPVFYADEYLWGKELGSNSQINMPMNKVSRILFLDNNIIQAFSLSGNKSVTFERRRYSDGSFVEFRVFLKDEDTGVMRNWPIEEIQSIEINH